MSPHESNVARNVGFLPRRPKSLYLCFPPSPPIGKDSLRIADIFPNSGCIDTEDFDKLGHGVIIWRDGAIGDLLISLSVFRPANTPSAECSS